MNGSKPTPMSTNVSPGRATDRSARRALQLRAGRVGEEERRREDDAAADQVGADQQLVEERGRRTQRPPRRIGATRRHSSGTVTRRKSGTANSTGRIPPQRTTPRSSSFAGSRMFRYISSDAEHAEDRGDRYIALADPLAGGCHERDHGRGLPSRKDRCGEAASAQAGPLSSSRRVIGEARFTRRGDTNARQRRRSLSLVEGSFVTIMFTDLVGSAALFARRGDEAADVVRREHFAALRRAVADNGGREVKTTGDGLMVVFASAVAALRCAVAMQRATGVAGPLELRIGLDAGEPLAGGRGSLRHAGDRGRPALRGCRGRRDPGLRSRLPVAGPRITEQIQPAGAMRLRGLGERVARPTGCAGRTTRRARGGAAVTATADQRRRRRRPAARALGLSRHHRRRARHASGRRGARTGATRSTSCGAPSPTSS